MNSAKPAKKMWEIANAMLQLPGVLARHQVELDQIKINQGLILAALQRQRTSKDLRDYEFKVFSQWGEDGILQHLVETIEIKNKTFIEFGVQDFSESNCRFLLMKDNWQGFVIDGSHRNIAKLRSEYYFWRYDLTAIEAFITKENINELLASSGFDQDIGILSVDIDGNDYHVLEAISFYRPRILVCEYNSVFGPDRAISVPYTSDFYRTAAHYSNLYFGASLAAMVHLARAKGYTLVGTNSNGVNAFFVRDDLVNDRHLRPTVGQAYAETQIRESRDQAQNQTYLSGGARLDLIAGLPVVNVVTGDKEAL